MVANPLYVNHTWIHHPTYVTEGMDRMLSKPEVARIFPTLPRRFIYREVIDQCFEDTYYKYHYSGNVKELKCPGPDRCL
ncbi:hypothetical protein TELCIR_13931, partial [Teladorsagia circumcincta]